MGDVVYLGTKTGRWTSSGHIEERPRYVHERFPPIVSQDTLDHAAAVEKRRADVRKLRIRAFIVALLCAAASWPFLFGYFLVVSAFAGTILRWAKGDPR